MQQAFAEAGAAQCGICTPGMVLAASALLTRIPQPTREQIREGLAGNICRCTGYQKIFDAVEIASRRSA
jgi:carbon-monoxide dehydrogenase small subunit